MPPFGAGLSKNCLCFALRPLSHSLLGSLVVDVGVAGFALSEPIRVAAVPAAAMVASDVTISARRTMGRVFNIGGSPVDGKVQAKGVGFARTFHMRDSWPKPDIWLDAGPYATSFRGR